MRAEESSSNAVCVLDWGETLLYRIMNLGVTAIHVRGDRAHRATVQRRDGESNRRHERDERIRKDACPLSGSSVRGQRNLRRLAGLVRRGAQGPVKL